MQAAPLDDAARQVGTPHFTYTAQGIGRGPVTITMPDGEVLHGRYQIMPGGSFGLAAVAGRGGVTTGMKTSTALSAPGEVIANGPTTVVTCDVQATIGGHGFGRCATDKGAHYQVMF
jgi:hypothetical protein